MTSTSGTKPRILILIKGLGIGGAETLIADSASLWDRESFEYRVVYLLPWKDQLVGNLEERGVWVTCLGWSRQTDWAALRSLRRIFDEWRPEIVHSHLPATGVLARTVLWHTEHVYTEHNVVDSYRRSSRLLNRATYARNKAVIAVSEAVALSIERYPGPEPIVVPNGVSVRVSDDEMKQARIELGIGPETPLVVHVGNIRPHKGHSNLIDAVAQLKDTMTQVAVVSIGGEKHEGDLRQLRNRAGSVGLADRMRFLGSRRDARSFIAAADVVVNPADVEGLPVSLLEALALERPVVATAVGGVPSIVRHRISGLLVPPADPVALARAIEEALTSDEAVRWGTEGARIVQEKHGLDRMVTAYEGIYRQILDA